METKIEAVEEKLMEVQKMLDQELSQLREEIVKAIQSKMEEIMRKMEGILKIGEHKEAKNVPEENRNGKTILLPAGLTPKIPMFDGNDPDTWLFKVERILSLDRLSEEERLLAKAIFMEGEALNWLRFEENLRRGPFRSWEEFKEQLLERFWDSSDGTPCEKFLALRQESTVREYRSEFERLAAPLKDIPEQVLEAKFMNGLKDDIQAELRLFQPVSVDQMMEIAQRIERRNEIL